MTNKPKDVLRAKKRRVARLQRNLNWMQVCVLSNPLPLDTLEILCDLTDAAVRILAKNPEELKEGL